MNGRQLGRDGIYNSLGQRIARYLHLYKAKYRAKERSRVQVLSRYIPEGGVVLDVGAHFGYFAKEFARLHGGSCTVYAFEPMEYTLGILKSVTKSMPNIELCERALSDSNNIVDLYIPVKKQRKIGPGLSHLGKETERDYIVQPVETIRLDDYIEEKKVPRVDFIKIDVEGAELLVLKGAASTISKYRPAIYAEVNDEYTKRLGYGASDIFKYLEAHGYSASFVLGNDFSLNQVHDYGGPGDYLFRH